MKNILLKIKAKILIKKGCLQKQQNQHLSGVNIGQSQADFVLTTSWQKPVKTVNLILWTVKIV